MRVYIETYGCARNRADAEIMEALLVNAGFKLSNLDSADYVIINTCAVKDPTETHMHRRIKELLDDGKKVIVAGCLPHISLEKIDNRVSAIIGVKSINRIVDAIRLAEEGIKLVDVEQKSLDKLELPRILKSRVAITIPISEGCLNACTYCATRFARGVLKSYSPEKIVKWVKEALAKGYKEIQLSSEDTGCYGFDIRTNLAKLLDEITSIEGEFRVRVGMANPNHIIKFLDELIDAYKDEKIYKFLHLPVQSGDNEVLRRMARTYTVEDFEEIVRAFRKEFPELNLNTDIIVGFPGEDEDAFQRTVELIKRVRPDKINVSRFSLRPKTLAARMPNQIHGRIAKQRSRILHRLRLSISYEINQKYIGREVLVLTHGHGEKGGIEGRTMNYKDIILPEDAPIGEFLKVKVTKATATYLMGEILDS